MPLDFKAAFIPAGFPSANNISIPSNNLKCIFLALTKSSFNALWTILENVLGSAFPITEIISENEYFDYEAKYNGKSKEVTPAEINKELAKKVQSLTAFIYKTLAMDGLARMDYIINENNIPFLIEINSVEIKKSGIW